MTATVAAPGTAVLRSSFGIEAFGGNKGVLADVNGDGELEMLIMQCAGSLGMDVERSRQDVDDRDRALFCLTAVTLGGQVLWQVGTPWQGAEPFTGHGSTGPVVADVDGDGRPEVMVIRHQALVVLDGATGAERNRVDLPYDSILNVYTAQLGDPAAGRQIICKTCGRAYAPWTYGNPFLIYNADLSLYKEAFEVRGAGHPCVAQDVNGDGRDELFLGYSMLDHEARELWRLDLGPDFDYSEDHADAIELLDIDGDGRPEVLYAGSEDFFVVNLEGEMLWRTHAGHSQNSVAGRFGPAGEMRIIMNEKNRGLWGLDAAGRILWNRTDINGYAREPVRWVRGQEKSWAIFRPQLRPFAQTGVPFRSDAAMCRDLWPRFLDGDGTLIEVLPWKEEYAQPARTIRARRSYDCGLLYDVIVQDIDDDGLDEIIVFDRYRVWIFGQE